MVRKGNQGGAKGAKNRGDRKHLWLGLSYLAKTVRTPWLLFIGPCPGCLSLPASRSTRKCPGQNRRFQGSFHLGVELFRAQEPTAGITVEP